MAYDLVITNGRIVDGSGMPAFRGDVAVRAGKIVALGKLGRTATRVIDADGLVVAPGFVDNHCHYDAQVTCDPLCSFSCYHGATTVIIGNCALALAPLRPGRQERVAAFLSDGEAIPMEVLRTVDYAWETIPQYMDRLEHHLGVPVALCCSQLDGHQGCWFHMLKTRPGQQLRGGRREPLALGQTTPVPGLGWFYHRTTAG